LSDQTDIAAKVAVLTTEHQSLRADHNAFLLEFRTFADDVRKSLSSSGKPNWSAVSVVIGAIVALASIYIAPLQVKIADQREIDSYQIENVKLTLELKSVEIETQFRAEDQMRNVQFATQQRMNAFLWEKAFGSRYPSDAIFYPAISK